MSGRLVEINRIAECYDSMGDWCKSIVDYFWREQTPLRKELLTLFAEPDSTAD